MRKSLGAVVLGTLLLAGCYVGKPQRALAPSRIDIAYVERKERSEVPLRPYNRSSISSDYSSPGSQIEVWSTHSFDRIFEETQRGLFYGDSFSQFKKREEIERRRERLSQSRGE